MADGSARMGVRMICGRRPCHERGCKWRMHGRMVMGAWSRRHLHPLEEPPALEQVALAVKLDACPDAAEGTQPRGGREAHGEAARPQ